MANYTELNVYKASKEQIIVTAFWDNRQNPKNPLEIGKNEK
jgi:hypothetical protein|tara:strand:- start:2020 stop:2142 length:123 start_codon:yes stop_codon:yes gene_type:complete